MKRLTVLLIFSLFLFDASYGQKALISGNIENLTANSIKCSFIPNTFLEKLTALNVPVTNGVFAQTLEITKPTFLSFAEGENYYGGFIEPGDSIVITYDAANMKKTLLFSGRGKEKFMLSDSIFQLRSAFNDTKEYIKNQPFPVDYLFGKIDSMQNKLVHRLIAYKPLMNKESFNLINAAIKSEVLRAKYKGAINAFGGAYPLDDIIKKQHDRLTDNSKKAIQSLLKFDNNLAYSYFYTNEVYNVLSLYYEENIKTKAKYNLQSKYRYLNKQLPLKLRSPVLFCFLDREIRSNKDAAIESVIEELFLSAGDSAYKAALNQKLIAARTLKNGMAAPDFSLENERGEIIHLSSLKNKVIYMDFWFASCAPCHALFKKIKPVKEYFKSSNDVIFLTISVDDSETWKKALTRFNIDGYHAFTGNKFKDHSVIKAYNVSSYPTTVLIDKKGNVFNIAPSENPDDLKKEIEAALMAGSN